MSNREVAQLAGRRMPYLATEGRQPPTGKYRPDYMDFLLVTEGEGRRVVHASDDSTAEHPMTPGQFYVFRPRDVHEIAGIGHGGMSVITITFPLETWERFVMASELDQRPFILPEPAVLEIDLNDPSKLRPFRRVLKAWERRLDTMDLVRFLAKTTPWFVEASGTGEEPSAPRWLRLAVAAMHEESNLRAGVPRLTELSHVSHTHLWRTTRTYFGMSPSELINGIRLHHAALLLRTTEISISEIAERCGYSSAAHFSTAFRSSHLVAPREFRKRTRT